MPADLPGSATAEQFSLQTFISVAVESGSPRRIVGTLCAVSRSRRYLGADDLAEVERLARLVGDRLDAG